jgi:hypothetical protein
MFKGDHPSLGRAFQRATACARRLGHPRVGVEHLLVGLAGGDDDLAGLLARHGATRPVLEEAACVAAPLGAGGAADRELLAPVGVDLEGLVGTDGTRTLDRLVGRQPLFPLGSGAARRRCASWEPPLGLDAQGAYGASLRLALARRERQHRAEHLAMVLVSLDPGANWVLAQLSIDRRQLLHDLERSFPAPRHRTVSVGVLGRWRRERELVRRYRATTGRSPIGPGDLAKFVGS